MPSNKPAPSPVDLRYPHNLDIKDLVTIVSVAISLAIAWGVFDTRVTVLEKDAIGLRATVAEQAATDTSTSIEIRKLEMRVQDDQHFIDDVYRDLKKPLPRRTNY